MDKKAFALLHAMEDSWWYRGRARTISRVLTRVRGTQEKILDLGAGFGGMADTLTHYTHELEGTEPDEASRAQATARGYSNMYEDLSSVKPPYNLVALFDVLEHVEDDHALLADLHTLLVQDGYLAMTVPAFQWLWSEHDVAHHHYRRYTTRSVRTVLEAAGFKVEYISYWNMLLCIPAAIVRVVFKRSGDASIGSSKLLDMAFYAVVYLESLLMPFISFPFGTGIVVLARKKE